VSISDVHLAIAFTLPPKLLIHLHIKHSLSRAQVIYLTIYRKNGYFSHVYVK